SHLPAAAAGRADAVQGPQHCPRVRTGRPLRLRHTCPLLDIKPPTTPGRPASAATLPRAVRGDNLVSTGTAVGDDGWKEAGPTIRTALRAAVSGVASAQLALCLFYLLLGVRLTAPLPAEWLAVAAAAGI